MWIRAGHTGWANAVAMSNSRLFVASGGDDRMLRIWRASDGALVREIAGHPGEIGTIDFSPDGGLIATGLHRPFGGSSDGVVRLWDFATGMPIREWPTSDSHVSHVRFSKDGAMLLTSGGAGRAELWRVADGTRITTYESGALTVQDACFDPAGARVATKDWFGTVRLFTLAGEQIDQFTTSASTFGGLAWAPNGKSVAAFGNQFIVVIDLETRLQRSVRNGLYSGHGLEFAPDGRTLLAAGLGSENDSADIEIRDFGTLAPRAFYNERTGSFAVLDLRIPGSGGDRYAYCTSSGEVAVARNPFSRDLGWPQGAIRR